MTRRGLEYHYDVLQNDDNAKLFTYLLMVLNLLYAILGAIMMGVGFFICFDQDFRDYLNDIDLDNYMAGVYILIVAGALVMIEAFFGICGAYLKKSFMLQIFSVMLLICIILEVAGASYLLVNGKSGTKLDSSLEVKFYGLIASYTYDITAKRTMDTVQEWIGCCGANGIADYIAWNMVVPNSCFNPVSGNAWYRQGFGYVGCVYAFTKYIEKGTAWIAALALVLAFSQIFGIICSCYLISIKKDFRSKSLGDLTKD